MKTFSSTDPLLLFFKSQGLVAGYSISACLRGFCFSLLNIRMTRRLRTQLFAAIIKRPVSFFDSTEVGQLTSRLQVGFTRQNLKDSEFPKAAVAGVTSGTQFLTSRASDRCACTESVRYCAGLTWQ